MCREKIIIFKFRTHDDVVSGRLVRSSTSSSTMTACLVNILSMLTTSTLEQGDLRVLLKSSQMYANSRPTMAKTDFTQKLSPQAFESRPNGV